MKTPFTVFGVMLAVSAGLWAAPTGSVRGYIKDSSGAVVSNATVELKNVVTNVTRRVSSDDRGYYQLLQIEPGTYELSAEAKGFRRTTWREVVLLVDQIVPLDVRLEIGQLTEVIEVSAGATALIETEKISTGANIDPKMVASLPLANRRFNDLALLTPGVRLSAAGSQVTGPAAVSPAPRSTS